MTIASIIVAAGLGTRLGDSTLGGAGPKALRLVDSKPLVRHAAQRLFSSGVQQLIVAIPAGYEQEFADALEGIDVQLVAGGASRQESVLRGLAKLSDDSKYVLVHDAARPLTPPAVIKRVIQALLDGASAVVPVVNVNDTIRQISGDGSQVVERGLLRAVQTPQGFKVNVLKDSHLRQAGAALTDDAGVCQACGHKITLVDGDQMAMKITQPIDFVIAQALLDYQKANIK